MSDSITARNLALKVIINGLVVTGAISLELFQTETFSADRFVLLMAFCPGSGASYYAELAASTVNISLSFDSSAGSTLIIGQVDSVLIDFNTRSARISGRDLSAKLIDSEVNQSFANQTSSEIAKGFALAAGLNANILETKVPVGQYYELAHTRTALGLHSRNATQWQLLATLAEIEGFSLFVRGATLHFTPVISQNTPTTLTYGRDLTTLCIDRAICLSDAKITVKSWNSKLKVAHQDTQGSGISTTLVVPNLMPAQVNNLSTVKQAQLVAQANLLRASMPGETTLLPRSWINVEGTNTTIDGLYIIQNIERYVDRHFGFTQTIEAYASP